jgi:hypothetical protein
MTASRTPALPIRRTDELEIPSPGIWPIVRSSSVASSTGLRNGVRSLHVVAGRFDIGDDPTQSSLRIDLDNSTLVASAVAVSPDLNGLSEWRFEGTAGSAERLEPFTLTLSYHGVFRRGIDVWARMSGTGTIGTPSGRRRRLRRSGDNRIFVDLLLTAPDYARIPRIPRIETHRSRRTQSRVMQLPSLGSQPVALALDGRAAHPSFAHSSFAHPSFAHRPLAHSSFAHPSFE